MVKAVTYNHASSTDWINETYDTSNPKDGIPDSVQIDSKTANAIQKDVVQGFTNELDSGQQAILARYVDKDTLEYSIDENKNAGANQIDTSRTGDTSDGNVIGWMANSASTSVGYGFLGGNPLKTGSDGFLTKNSFDVTFESKPTTTNPTTPDPAVDDIPGPEDNVSTDPPSDGGGNGGDGSGESTKQAGDKSEKTAEVPWMALVAGGIALAAGAMALVGVDKFDDQYNNRMEEDSNAEDNNTTIQNYTDEMVANMDQMNADYATYEELSGEELTRQINVIGDMAALQIEIATLEAQGIDADDKKTQLTKLEEDSQKPSDKAEDMNELKDGIDYYASRSAEAQGVKESGATVSEFLQDGETMGVLAYVQAGLMLIGGLLMVKGSINAIKSAASIPWPANVAAAVVAWAGAAMMIAGNVMVIGASGLMMKKADDELDCASAGDGMADNVNTLQENIDSQTGITDETSSAYTAMDAESTTRAGEVQENSNESVQKTEEGLNNNK